MNIFLVEREGNLKEYFNCGNQKLPGQLSILFLQTLLMEHS